LGQSLISLIISSSVAGRKTLKSGGEASGDG